MATVDVDVSEFREFFSRIGQAASGDFRHEMELFLEGLGNEFLRVLQDEIIRRKVMDASCSRPSRKAPKGTSGSSPMAI